MPRAWPTEHFAVAETKRFQKRFETVSILFRFSFISPMCGQLYGDRGALSVVCGKMSSANVSPKRRRDGAVCVARRLMSLGPSTTMSTYLIPNCVLLQPFTHSLTQREPSAINLPPHRLPPSCRRRIRFLWPLGRPRWRAGILPFQPFSVRGSPEGESFLNTLLTESHSIATVYIFLRSVSNACGFVLACQKHNNKQVSQ